MSKPQSCHGAPVSPDYVCVLGAGHRGRCCDGWKTWIDPEKPPGDHEAPHPDDCRCRLHALYRVAADAGELSRVLGELQRQQAIQRRSAVVELLRDHGQTYAEVAAQLDTTKSNVQAIIRPLDTAPKRGTRR